MQSQLDVVEERDLAAQLGPTTLRDCRFELDASGYAYWLQATALSRRAEVVMAVHHPDGRLLVHTKTHYPPGTWRLPSGGIRWGEPVLEALAREQWEELGLSLAPRSMPGLVHYTFHHAGRTVPFASYIFSLYPAQEPTPVPMDPDEPISAFRWIEPGQLATIAAQLRGVIRTWGGWGPFRAVVHDFLGELWMSAPDG